LAELRNVSTCFILTLIRVYFLFTAFLEGDGTFMFEVIFVVMFVLLFIVGMLFFIFWLTHLDMVKIRSESYGFGSFKKFKEQFQKYQWKPQERFQTSLFGTNHSCSCETKIHASIIKFEGVGMLLYPWDYFRVVMFVRKFIKTNYPPKTKHKW